MLYFFSVGSFQLNGQSMVVEGKKMPAQRSESLQRQFVKYDIFKIDANQLYEFATQQYSFDFQLDLDGKYNWNIYLEPNNILASGYILRTAGDEGESIHTKTSNRTFKGFLSNGQMGNVSLTLHHDFIYGFIQQGNKAFFIEPLRFFKKGADKDLFIVYKAADVIEPEEKGCGFSDLHHQQKKIENHQKHHEDSPDMMNCWTIELAIASDFLMYQKYNNSVPDVENHNIAVMNNVQNNYDNEFADQLEFEIVEQFVATSAAADPWTNSTNAGALLNSFTAWGPTGFTQTHDLGSLWTDRDFNGGTIGIAWLSSLCDSDRYHCLQDFTNNANFLRVLTSHEIGHNLSATHDPSGSPFIMAPAVNNTNNWSTQTVNQINNHINANVNVCLNACQSLQPPVADFSALITNLCPGSSTVFYDQSLNNPTSWSWSFPGGTPASSTDPSPEVTYNNPGTYPVTMTVTNGAGADVASFSAFIFVGAGGDDLFFYEDFENGLGQWTVDNPDGGFTWETFVADGTLIGSQTARIRNFFYNSPGQKDALISPVIDLSGRGIARIEMDYAHARYGFSNADSLNIYVSTDGGNTFPFKVFGDSENGSGNFATVPQQTTEFIPSDPTEWCYQTTFGPGCINVDISAFGGEPNVVVKVENVNDHGNNLFIDNFRVVTSCFVAPPVAGFIASPSLGCAPLSVNFTDLSLGEVTGWLWDFPGGDPSSSTLQFPTVTYNNPGLFDATLTVSNIGGSNTLTIPNFITVLDVPTTDFTYSSIEGTVDFFNQSSGATSYLWDFGDGTTSTLVNPTHTYGQDSTYIVTLVASNDCGSVTYTETIVIVTSPSAGFTSDVTTGCAPLTVQFIDQSTDNVDTWQWNFPGGTPNSSSLPNPVITFDSAGVYDVSLTVINGAGSNTAIQNGYIEVFDPPVALFQDTSVLDTVIFTNQSGNATSFFWDFGDGDTSTVADPIHVYDADSTYTVTLIAMTPGCENDTFVSQVTISTFPVAGFSADTTNGCADLIVQFSNQSSSNVDNIEWLFPGGSPASSQLPDPVVAYSTPGTFDVSLIASNTSGSDTLVLEDYITVDGPPAADFTSSANLEVVDFQNFSIEADSFLWNFGDNQSSNEVDPSHTYSSNGIYTVQLIAYNECGADTIEQNVFIVTLPTAGFSANPTIGCADLSVQFNNQSSVNADNYNWTFPGGSPGTSQLPNPVVNYTTPGSYDVTLIASNTAGSDTLLISNFITVEGGSTADFTATSNLDTANFVDLSINADSVFWNFGDNQTSTESNPTHIYNTDGTYTVQLIAFNDCGNDTVEQQITIITAPTAGASADVTEGCADLEVQFFNQSSDNADTFEWSFPGGSPPSSQLPDPIVVYQTPGNYDATLIVSNAAGSDTLVLSNFINVQPQPTADFNTSINLEVVDFTNLSIEADSLLWNFGDNQTSNEVNPTHIYSADGVYTAQLIAFNECGTDTFEQQITIITAPTAGASADVNVGCPDLEVQFSNQSSDNADAFEWSFPGGSPTSSQLPDPVVTYQTPGNYDVTLIVSNAVGSDTLVLSNFVDVQTQPNADFSTSVNLEEVDFTNLSIEADSFLWNFGDSQTSNEINPTHTYDADGVYTAQLIVFNECGTDTFEQQITIITAPTAGASADVNVGCPDLEVQFSNQSSDNADTFEWSFPGGSPTISQLPDPVVVYQTPGNYDVTLIVSNAVGSDTLVLSNFIDVQMQPTADFSASINLEVVDFTNLSIEADSFLWNFGDSQTSNEANPTHTYDSDGVYTAQLIVFNECGTDTFEQQITIITAPTAGASADVNVGCPDLEVQFSNQSSDNADTFEWSFPGGSPTISQLPDPVVVYQTPGNYDVTLIVSNAVGSDTLVLSNFIDVQMQPTADFSASINLEVVDFTNLSIEADSFLWNFGDSQTSNEINPTHTYDADGVYTAQLIVFNECGTDTFEQQITIITAPTAGASADVNVGCPDLEVQFSNQSSDNADTFEWSFPGGSPTISQLPDPVVVYQTPGNYDVTLIVTNAVGSDTLVLSNFIDVQTQPTADFSASINLEVVDFTNLSIEADSFLWNFGDSQTSNEANPTHTYDSDGVYTAQLIVFNECGTDTFEQQITIITAPTAGASADVNVGCPDLEVQFSNQSSDNADTFEWSFPGGSPTISQLPDPVVVYQTPGNYDVTLIVTNAVGSDTLVLSNFIDVQMQPTADFSASVDLEVVDFTNLSIEADSFLWNFGDSQTSNDVSPTHIYNADGVYTAQLIVFNECGTDTFEQELTIVTLPAAGFSSDITEGCSGVLVQFFNQSSSNAENFNWSFQGGTPSTSTEENPVIEFTGAGSFDVSLTVSNDAGNNTATTLNYIVISPDPDADFTFMVNGSNVGFTNQSSNANTYQWDFGDNQTSEISDPIHTYSNDGTYDVSLIVTNDCGMDTIIQQVTVVTPTSAGFNADVTEGCPTLEVQFQNLSSPNAQTFEWLFPGAIPASSILENPVVSYDTPGTYDVTLIAGNAAGTDTLTLSNFITVAAEPPASYNYSSNLDTVQFNNTSLDADSVLWNFGDNQTSTEMNPLHIYDMDGEYIVELTVFNDCGMDTFIDTLMILTPPAVGFKANQTNGCAPLTINFVDLSLGTVTEWLWETPGGNPSSSIEENPVIIYENPGFYDVTLTVSNAAGSSTISQINYIDVSPEPTAGFDLSIDGSVVNFENTSADVGSYLWDFGNNMTSTAENPVMDYQEDGTYIVSLTATNNCGSTMVFDTIEIATPPTAGFDISTITACPPFDFMPLDESSNNTIAWEWFVFGPDTLTATGPEPLFTLTTPGQYSVMLIASNAQGNDTLYNADQITIEAEAEASFDTSVDNLEVTFTNNSSNATDYLWGFGDDEISNEENPTHIYSDYGTYTITLIAFNNCGTDTSSVTIDLEPAGLAPSASFSGSPLLGCVPEVVSFTDESTNDPTSWEWILPGADPGNSSLQNPVVTYNETGTYDVTLIASNSFGSDTLIQAQYIVIEDVPTASFDADVLDNTVNFTNTSTNADGFLWLFGDNQSSNEENPQHTYNEQGNYEVILIASNDCGTDTSRQELDIFIDAIGQISTLEKVLLFPNPSDGKVFLQLSGEAGPHVHFQLFDVLGRNLYSEKEDFTSGQLNKQFDWNHLAAGTYILQLSIGEELMHWKLILTN